MKTLLYTIVILFAGLNLTSCTPEEITEEIEQNSTVGEDGDVGEEDDDGTDD